jgi:hypothetical protein
VVVISQHHFNQSISVFNSLLRSVVTPEQSRSAEFSGNFLALKDKTALVLVELVIWLYGYLVILLHGYFFLVKVFLVLNFV